MFAVDLVRMAIFRKSQFGTRYKAEIPTRRELKRGNRPDNLFTRTRKIVSKHIDFDYASYVWDIALNCFDWLTLSHIFHDHDFV